MTLLLPAYAPEQQHLLAAALIQPLPDYLLLLLILLLSCRQLQGYFLHLLQLAALRLLQLLLPPRLCCHPQHAAAQGRLQQVASWPVVRTACTAVSPQHHKSARMHHGHAGRVARAPCAAAVWQESYRLSCVSTTDTMQPSENLACINREDIPRAILTAFVRMHANKHTIMLQQQVAARHDCLITASQTAVLTTCLRNEEVNLASSRGVVASACAAAAAAESCIASSGPCAEAAGVKTAPAAGDTRPVEAASMEGGVVSPAAAAPGGAADMTRPSRFLSLTPVAAAMAIPASPGGVGGVLPAAAADAPAGSSSCDVVLMGAVRIRPVEQLCAGSASSRCSSW